MRKQLFAIIIGYLLIWPLGSAAGSLSSNEIMDKLETRYDVKGIFVQFHQTTTLKALDITDLGEGRIFIKQPGRMRWEYDSPEKHAIITDGDTLWIYRPDDNQVMTGKAATFFGEGMGGVFLSDMTAIRRHFSIELIPTDAAGDYTLELTPNKATGNIQAVLLTVSKETFNVTRVITQNAYGDETCLTFEDSKFDQELDDGLFVFSPPEGTEELSLD